MRLFFDSIDSINQFTTALKCQQTPLRCKHCCKKDQFVSHGFVYIKQYGQQKKAVGKRIICSNRYGKNGCGRTLRLYLAWVIPACVYSTIHFALFLNALIAGKSIKMAYFKATNNEDPRQAYRWLNKLKNKLITYNTILQTPESRHVEVFNNRCQRLQILLPTIQRLFKMLGHHPCMQYQKHQQQAFI